MNDLPRGTVTFLFTDIEGSTRLWNAFPETMPVAYARHDAILRDAVAAHGGVAYKTIGDALQTMFSNAVDGVVAAVEAQRALQAEDWPMPEPLRVRMALHTGAVDPDADEDYRSPVLNRLGRLLGSGHGGQVLVSQATMELARDHLPPGLKLIDLGEQRLKDLYRPERVWQIGGEGLADAFPVLRTLDTRPNNLPTQLTQFIGRQDDVATTLALLHREDVRLVTLTGPGGMGKTRLALQVGADALEAFADGVFLARLDTVTDPALVPAAMAQALGLREDREVSAATAVANYLRDRELLLILDNFEQVVDSASYVGELLLACSGLKVLATSRVRLQVRGEQEFPVRPLRLPDLRRQIDIETLTQYESVRLFIERAEAVKPAFAATNNNAPAIAEICARLDGLPLAIELAAAKVRMLPPEAMLRRLTSRLPLLTGGARDLPARQQTLRGAIAWSYELLSPEDQALFRRMAVFAGGASFEAIEAVAADEGQGWEVFDGLERLVDQSLVRQSELAGEARFSTFETIREFGLEELEQHGETEEAHRVHAGWYADFARALRTLKEPDVLVDQLDRVELEADNARAACAWALEHDLLMAYRLVAGLGEFWTWRSPTRNEKDWVQDVLSRETRDVEVRDRMDALAVSVSIRVSIFDTPEDIERARLRGEEALRLAESRGEYSIASQVLIQLGIIAFMGENSEQSMDELLQRGIHLARAIGDVGTLHRNLNNAGYLKYLEGDLRRAREYLEEALALARTVGEIHAIAAVNSMADLARGEGDLVQAEAMYAEGASSSVNCKMFFDISVNLMGLVITAAATGRWERAAWIAGAIASYRNTGDLDIEGQADLLGLANDYERAVARTRETLGREAFVREWSEGSAVPVDDAVERATSTAMRVVV